jgi:predicted deacylase
MHNFGTIFAELHADRASVIAIMRRNPLVSPGDHLCLVSPDISVDATFQN